MYFRITFYSAFMSILLFTIIIFIYCILSLLNKKIYLPGAFFFIGLCVLRLFLPYEFVYAYIIESWTWYPRIRRVYNTELFNNITVLNILIFIWAAGVILSVIHTIWKLYSLHQVCKYMEDIKSGNSIYACLEKVIHHIGYKGDYKLSISPFFSSPVSVGYFKLHIVVPAYIEEFDEEEMEGIFLHEISHFLSKDLWIKLFFLILRCIFWWNPIVYMLFRNIEQLLELRCDQNVCSRLSEKGQIKYCEAILHTVRNNEKKQENTVLNFSGIISEIYLKQRFRLLAIPKSKMKFRDKFIRFGLGTAVFLLSYMIVLQPASLAPKNEIEDCYEVTNDEKNTFIIKYSDGKYFLVEYGSETIQLSEEQMRQAPYNKMEIVEVK